MNITTQSMFETKDETNQLRCKRWSVGGTFNIVKRPFCQIFRKYGCFLGRLSVKRFHCCSLIKQITLHLAFFFFHSFFPLFYLCIFKQKKKLSNVKLKILLLQIFQRFNFHLNSLLQNWRYQTSNNVIVPDSKLNYAMREKVHVLGSGMRLEKYTHAFQKLNHYAFFAEVFTYPLLYI